MKMTRCFAAALTLLSALSAGAADITPAEQNPNAPASNERNKDESWYWGFNLGRGSVKYTDSSNQTAASTLRASANVDHSTVYFDLLFLWPLAHKQTAIGVGIGGVVDGYESKSSPEKIAVTTSLLTFSAQHFFSSNIGDGFFARGDIGVSSVKAEYTSPLLSASSDTKSGLGLRLGLGYSILLSSETRLPITLQFQHATADGDNGSNATVLTVGLLF